MQELQFLVGLIQEFEILRLDITQHSLTRSLFQLAHLLRAMSFLKKISVISEQG